ncbi:MFS transporter [Actinokineospora sp. NBRC 105648]|uniref:MFS transporter n=1 Tax=Actinokineospora sp. NBRC 105648 TaxID=3032206 RepID=UPI0024A57960|nr:MFS transporter [Actinokineospora sp. NBRC 105648]GLZ38342.1 MFS transporter [Actinokineospora sp. NBRC 105648]
MSPASRWPVVLAFAALGVSTQLCWLAYAATTTATAQHLGVSEQAVGWLANVFPLLFVVLAVPAGVALDRWFRPTLAVGAVLIAVGASLRFAVDEYWAALAGQTLAAIAQPIVANAITRVAAGYLAPKDRPLGIAVGAGATYVGMIVAIGLGTALPGDVRTVVGIGTAIAVLTAVAALVSLRVPPPFLGEREAVGSLRVALREPGVPVLAAVVLLGTGIFVSLATWLEPLLKPAGVSSSTSGLLLLVVLVSGVVGCVLVPPFAARRHWESRTLQVTALVTAAACLLLGFAPAATGFVAAVPIGFLLLSALPVALSRVERGGSASAGTITSVVWMAANTGGVVVSSAVGYLLDLPVVAFTVFAVLAVSAFLLARRLEHQEDQVAGTEGHDELAGSRNATVGQDSATGPA